MTRYRLKKLVMVKNGKIFDTTYLFAHVECYFIRDGGLYSEQIDGTEVYMGKVVAEADSIQELARMVGEIDG